jgi:hypothetical protein
MNPIDPKIVEELNQALASEPNFRDGRRTLQFDHAGDRLTCQLAALDSLACSIVELELHSDRLAGANPKRLEQIAAALSKRICYLLEPITPIEVDTDRCIVQMRSNPPRKHAAGTDYYELLVTADGRIHLARYSRAPGATRAPIAAQLTHEVLVRLAGDFVAAANA